MFDNKYIYGFLTVCNFLLAIWYFFKGNYYWMTFDVIMVIILSIRTFQCSKDS